jgi:hypothetical protein
MAIPTMKMTKMMKMAMRIIRRMAMNDKELMELVEIEAKRRREWRDLALVIVSGFGAGFLLAIFLAWIGCL